MTDKPLAELGKRFNQISRDHGFWDKERNFGELMALIHSEVSEAFEEYRQGYGINDVYYHSYGMNSQKYPVSGYLHTDEERNIKKPEGIPIELADIIIRVLELCYSYGIDIDTMVELKSKYNETRPYMHGKIA